MFKSLSIRWKLILPFLFIIALMVGVLVPGTRTLISNQIEQESDRRLLIISNSVAALIEDSENQARLSANLVGNLTEIEQAVDDIDLLGAELEIHRESLGLQELNYYGEDFEPGDQPLYYGGPIIARRLQVSQKVTDAREDLVLQVLETGQSAQTTVMAPQASQIIGVSPVGMGGDGVVMAVFYIDNEYVERIKGILDADVALVANNAIVASTISSGTGYEQLLREGEIVMMGEDEGAINLGGDDQDEQTRLLARPLMIHNNEQGMVMVAQPIQDLVSSTFTAIQNLLYLFAAIIALTSLAVGLLTLSNFSRPLELLLDATRKVSDGDFSYRVGKLHNYMRDEVIELGENFNTMTERLDELYGGLENKVTERTAELKEATDQLAIARDQALEASRAKSTFLANMSHELRTPLNAIIGYSEMLLEDVQISGYSEMEPDLDKIISSGKHLLGLINDILDLSKIEAGKMDIYSEPFNISQLITDTAATVQPLMEKNSNRLELNFPDDIGAMYSDLTKVRQILLNLLSNAAKFTDNGVITLEARRSVIGGDEWIVYSVADNGIGMTRDQIDGLFQAFAQADSSTTRNYGGTGLGLAICKHFSIMLGGDITVESIPNEGSKFTLLIPAEIDDDSGVMPKMEPQQELSNVIQQTTNGAADGDCTVLIIDDDDTSRDLMTRYLQKENLHTLTATSGEEGLSMAKSHRPDVITLDVIMPDLDGWSLLTKLKSDPELRDIPVIIVSMLGDKNTGYALGASEYLIKPIDRDQLTRTIQKYRCETSPCKVLLVEDDDNTRDLMRSMLTKDGWIVEEAENGKSALDKVSQESPNLIVLDLMMPEMDGFDFVAQLRVKEQWRDIPIIVVTAKDITREDQLRLSGHVQKIYQKGDYSKENLLLQVRNLILKHTSS